MSRNKNTRLLLVIFVVLLVAVVINQLIKSSRGERSFREDIVEYQADEINKITIHAKGDPSEDIELVRDDSIWKLQSGGKEYSADQSMAAGIVDELTYLKPDRLVAKKKEVWPNYDVTDSAGLKVTVSGPKNSKTDLIIGRFSYNQQTRKPTTYIRLSKEHDVYAVDGYLSMTFSRDLNSLRDKTIYRGNKNDFTRITFSYPADSSFVLVKEDNQWLNNGVPVDSANMAGYLNNLGYLTANDFRDDFSPGSFIGETLTLSIEGINMQTLEIKGYQDTTGIVVNSSLNSDTYFSGDTGGLAGKIFKGRSYFMPSVQ